MVTYCFMFIRQRCQVLLYINVGIQLMDVNEV